MLFALRAHQKALFDAVLIPKLERYGSLPPIRTPMGRARKACMIRGLFCFIKSIRKPIVKRWKKQSDAFHN